jgi:hypothetical protein
MQPRTAATALARALGSDWDRTAERPEEARDPETDFEDDHDDGTDLHDAPDTSFTGTAKVTVDKQGDEGLSRKHSEEERHHQPERIVPKGSLEVALHEREH